MTASTPAPTAARRAFATPLTRTASRTAHWGVAPGEVQMGSIAELA